MKLRRKIVCAFVVGCLLAMALIPHGNEDQGVIIPPEMVQEVPPPEELPLQPDNKLPDLFEDAFDPMDATMKELREYVYGMDTMDRIDWSSAIRSMGSEKFREGVLAKDNEKIREAREIYLRCKEIAPTEDQKAEYDNLIRLCDAVLNGASTEELQRMAEEMQELE